MDSYENDTSYLIKSMYYRRYFCKNDDGLDTSGRPKVLQRWNSTGPKVYLNNSYWLIERLSWDDIRYEDVVTRDMKNPCIKEFDGKKYDLRFGEDAVQLYNDITGKNEKCMSVYDYARYLKERKMKNEYERCNMGRD